MNRFGRVLFGVVFWCFGACAAQAQDFDDFSDGPQGTKTHTPSGFTCPAKIGTFDRNAVGIRNPAQGSAYCAYSARDGVYGSVQIAPMRGNFDPKTDMAEDFVAAERAGAHFVSETTISSGPQAVLPVYTRLYETARTETLRYRTVFACAVIGAWVVRTTVEYASPRDDAQKEAFIASTYATALDTLGR